MINSLVQRCPVSLFHVACSGTQKSTIYDVV